MRDIIKALGLALFITLILVAFIALVHTIDTKLSVKPSIVPSSFEMPTPVMIQMEPPATTYAASNLYAKTGQVVGLDMGADLVRFVDSRGMEWEFYGVEDWNIGDKLCAIFYDKNTMDPLDDQIIKATYEAYDY